MNYILYISYGHGPHELEIRYSIITADYKSGGFEFRAVIYTDNPEAFRDLDAEVCYISTDTWKAWAGLHGFAHRRKIMALQHAIEAYASPVVLLDGDTWLRGSVQQLFRRIGPGKTLMHIREGRVSEVDTPVYKAMRGVLAETQVETQDGQTLLIPADSFMWNAGVIGLHHSDKKLLSDVLLLTDQLLSNSDLHVLEQFAFSWVLMNQTELCECADVVFHYWPPYLHQPFREQLPGLFDTASQLPANEKQQFLYGHRPRPDFRRRVRVLAKRVMQFAGLIQGRCRSNEW